MAQIVAKRVSGKPERSSVPDEVRFVVPDRVAKIIRVEATRSQLSIDDLLLGEDRRSRNARAATIRLIRKVVGRLASADRIAGWLGRGRSEAVAALAERPEHGI